MRRTHQLASLAAAAAAVVATSLALVASRPGPPARGAPAPRAARGAAAVAPDAGDEPARAGGRPAELDAGPEAEPDADVAPAPPARSAPAAGGARAPDPRAPIVRAIRASYARELDRRDAMVRELEASGPSREAWTRGAGAAFGRWLRDVTPEGAEAPRLGEPRCFAAGCAAAVTFADRAAADAFAARVRATPHDWAGGRAQTPPEELASGEVLATWMLLRPDEL